ncbi:MAG: Hsp33 family molecular chaperone HslO [Oscillospiraceae bacterium]|jgi:molecular chaperone Hsp33|nr:Hsp33 family molecular chaperone HslO [Oscillospiraceae bacterium]
MQDYLVRAVTSDGFLKAAAISSKNLVERARNIHACTPTATAALGRLLTAASMMGNMQKVENGALTLQVKGGGPLGTLLVVSDAVGNVRGYVQNAGISLLEKYAGKLDVGAAVGTDGMLTVIRDLQMKEPYHGSTELVSGEIADDITAYFARSEQIPTACALGVLVDVDQSVSAAGGYIIQLLPGAPEELIEKLEQGIREAGAVTPLLAQGLQPEQLLSKVMPGFELEFLEKTQVEYRCYCDRARVTATLITLGKGELQEIVDEGEPIQVECQFCDTLYKFTPAEIKRILEKL